MIRKLIKFTLITVLVLAVAAFLAFLYFIPPFFITPPEQFGKDMAAAAPGVSDIADPAIRAIVAPYILEAALVRIAHRLADERAC